VSVFHVAIVSTTINAATLGFTDQALFIAATNSLTVDNFDATPWTPTDTPLTQPVSSLGNSWTASNNLEAVSVSLSGAQSISSIDGDPDLTDSISAALGGSNTAVGGFVQVGNADGVTLSAFGAGDTLLGTVTTTLPGGWQFLGLTSTTSIARIELISTSPPVADDFALDDFHFGAAVPPAAVPLPAAIWVFGSGLLGMIGVARRKKAA
jgi:hypothetical protein